MKFSPELVFKQMRLPLGQYHSMGEFYEDDRYAAVTRQIYGQLQITEEHVLFPIISGITLKSLPEFLKYLQVPQAAAETMQQMILSGRK